MGIEFAVPLLYLKLSTTQLLVAMSICQHIRTLFVFNLNVGQFYLLEFKYCLFYEFFSYGLFFAGVFNIGHYGGNRRP